MPPVTQQQVVPRRTLPGFVRGLPSFLVLSPVFTQLHLVRAALGRFLSGFTEFYWVLLGFTGFHWVSLGFTGFHWVSLGFTGFYWVLLGFTGFY